MFFLQPASYGSPPLNGAGERERAVVATLLYYDLFSFPLNTAELVRFAHSGGNGTRLREGDLVGASAWWSSRNGYWFLLGREALVARRGDMTSISAAKLALARRWARRLQWLPGVRFVGITGSLAMNGAAAEDDIDLLIITAARQLWLTRALVLAFLWAIGIKRSDDGRLAHPNQACANVFLSEGGMALTDRNLFIAHELCQMVPLLGPQAYERFLQANRWAREYLPQWEPATPHWEDRRPLRLLQRALELILWPARGWMERAAAKRQLGRIRSKHARGHNADVHITPTQLRFNPGDHAQEIMAAFEARWEALSR